MGLATTWDVEMGLLECWREVGLWGGRGRVVSNLLSYPAYLTPKGKGQESHWKDESEFRRSVQAEGTMIFKAVGSVSKRVSEDRKEAQHLSLGALW